MDKDTVANLVTVSAVGLTLTDITVWLTIASLVTAVVLNGVRIFYTIQSHGKKSINND